MKIHAIHGIMARRMLVNFRIRPDVAARLLPTNVRPRLVRGHAIAGLCLVKLTQMKPAGSPRWLPGFTSENVAVRMGVQWGTRGDPQNAVLIFRRDTASTLNALFGGRFFPGPTNPAQILSHDRPNDIRIAVRSTQQRIDVAAREGGTIPATSAFQGLDEAATFFRGGERGYSPARRPGLWDGLALTLDRWSLRPLTIDRVRSRFMDQINAIAPGSAVFDSAFIMRDIPHTWTALPQLALGTLPELPAAPETRANNAQPPQRPQPVRRTRAAQPDLILH